MTEPRDIIAETVWLTAFYGVYGGIVDNKDEVADAVIAALDTAGYVVVKSDRLVIPPDFGEMVMKVKLASERLLITMAEMVAFDAGQVTKAE